MVLPNYHVIISDRALADLQGIAGFIRTESPESSAAVAEMLLAAIDSLAALPNRFRIVGKSRKRGSPIHAMVERPFIIYYDVNERTYAVNVVTIRHGAKRQPRRFD